MFQVTRTQRRVDTSVNFFTMHSDLVTQELRDYFVSNFKRTGKCLNTDTVITDDDLLYTLVSYWKNENDFNEFMDDPYIKENFLSPMKEYIVSNNIVTTVTKETI